MSEHNLSSLAQASCMEQIVRVVSVKGNWALVEGNRLSGCQSCAESSQCGTGLLAAYTHKPVAFWLANEVNAKAGDYVVVGLKPRYMLQASLLAYVVPAAIMVACVLASAALGASDFQAIAWAVIGLLTALTAVQIFSHSLEGRFGTPEMLRVENGPERLKTQP